MSMIYSQTARFDNAQPLTEDELRKLAPGVFATTKADDRSDRFTPIPTIEMLRALAEEGFQAVGAQQTKARRSSDHGLHLIRLRKLDEIEKYTVGDSVLEMYLKNANDGTSPYALMAGLYRILCMNSLTAHTSTVDEIRIRHTGDAVAKVIEGSREVIARSEKVLNAPREWSKIFPSLDARMEFAETARVIRFGEGTRTDIDAAKLLVPRRKEDEALDGWSVTNVVQENCMRGGLTGTISTTRGVRRTTTKGIAAIRKSIEVNRALWEAAERMVA